jgi:hypothetical protein
LAFGLCSEVGGVESKRIKNQVLDKVFKTNHNSPSLLLTSRRHLQKAGSLKINSR